MKNQGLKGGRKLRRCYKDEGYYKAYRQSYSGKLIRRRANRERRLKAALEHPEIGSPSQLKLRRKKTLKSIGKQAYDLVLEAGRV